MVKDVMHRTITSIEQAENILENGFIELEDAVEYLKANDKNNAVLAKYSNIEMEDFKKQRAAEIYTGKKKINTGRGSFNRETQAADRYIKELLLKGEDLRSLFGLEVSPVEEKVIEDANNVKIPPENSEAVEKNREWIKKAYKDFEVADDKEGKVPAWRRHNADVLDRIKFVDDKGNESEDIRKKSEDTIWEIAKNEVLRERSFDFSFMKLKEEDRLKLLRADLSDSIAKTSLGVVGIAPVLNRRVDGEIAAEELAKVDAKLSVQALDKYLSDKGTEKAAVSQSAVVGAAIKESETMESFISYIEKKQYSNKVVEGFKEDHKSFGEKMKTWWGNAWTMGKEYVANNRTRLIVDTAATIAMISNPVTLGSVAAYAAYATIGSAVWPIVEKRRKMIRQAKREGRSYSDYKLGLSFNGLRKAWKDIKSDEKEMKRYKNRVKAGAVAGVVIAGGLGALSSGLVTGLSAAGARIASSIARSTAAVGSQILNFRDTKKDLKLEDNAENRAAYKSAKTGLWIGGTIAALAAAWGIYNIMDSQVDANVSGGKATDEHAQKAAEKVAKKTAKAAERAAEEAPVAETEIPYPPVWSAESGLSQRHFEEMYGKFDAAGKWHCGKITGILSRQNQAFDEWNAAHPGAPRTIEVKDPAETYKDMIRNLHKAREADPTLFAGKTDDQVMYQYIKLVEYSEKAKNGPIVNGIHTLITVTDKDGVPTYASNQAEMQAMFKMLRCGEKVEVSAAALNANLDRIDLNTGKGIGAEFSAKITNNSFWGYGEDCKDGVSMWKRGLNAVKKVFTKDADVKTVQTVELPQEDAEVKSVTELQPVDAQVRSFQTRELVVEDADASATYTEANVTLGRGTSDKLDNDLTDPTAQRGKTVGSSVGLKGTNKKVDVDTVELMKTIKEGRKI